MRRMTVNTFWPDCAVAAFFSSERATRRTRSWSMPSAPAPEDRFASAVSYLATIAPASSRSAGPSVKFNGEVSDTAGRDVGGYVDLAPAHNAQVDHALARRGVEAPVGGRQAGALERVHQPIEGLAVVDPAKELPDRQEVLDVV